MPGKAGGGRVREGFVGKTSQDFDGLRIIWEFFKSCPPRRQANATDNEPLAPETKP
jgi:hypothetical protein